MLTPDQLAKISEISNPVARQRFTMFFQLPQDLQNSMVDEKISGSIWTITKNKYQLPDSKVSVAAKIIGLIFLGELPIKNFIVALRDELRIDNQTAASIAQDINQAIFQPVRESLMKVHGLSPENGKLNAESRNSNQNITSAIKPPSTLYPPPAKPMDRPDNPFTVKPAYYNVQPKKIVDLRKIKRKNRYNGFFTS